MSFAAGRSLTPAGKRSHPPDAPTALRQTVFDILAHSYGDPVRGARVLDLFAGTGALGLEALSRGAASALFVEDGVEARGLIRGNVEALGLTGRTRIFRRDATDLGDAGNLPPFTLVFADPPYGQGLGEKALAAAVAGGWLAARRDCGPGGGRGREIEPIKGLALSGDPPASAIPRFISLPPEPVRP